MHDRSGPAPLALVAQSVSVDGNRIRIGSGPAEIEETAESDTSLRARLAHLIYLHLYSRASNIASSTAKPAGDVSIMPELLSAVPRTRDVDWAWQVRTRHKTGSIVVSSRDRIAELRAGEYLFAPGIRNEGGEARAGLLKWSVEYNDVDDWLLIRHRMHGIARSPREVRIYFNAHASGAAKLVSSIVETLARWDIPFALKCHSRAGNYRRRDAVILYLDRRDAYIALETIGGDYRSLAEGLRPDVPLFTFFYLPGIGFAETPGDGGSFGLARSRLCANALADARGRTPGVEERLQILQAAFLDAGLSFHELFRNPGDRYAYDYVRINDMAARALC
jgi:hypothetical protein